jgi:acetoin utilization protein AcuB
MSTKTTGDLASVKLITIPVDATMIDAQKLMTEHRFRHLPVTNRVGEIIGIISDRDIQRALSITKSEHSPELVCEMPKDFKVKDFMSWPAHKISSECSVRETAMRMLNEKISALIVEDKNENFRGIITTDDLIRYLISLLEKDPGRLKLALDAVFEDFSPVRNWA